MIPNALYNLFREFTTALNVNSLLRRWQWEQGELARGHPTIYATRGGFGGIGHVNLMNCPDRCQPGIWNTAFGFGCCLVGHYSMLLCAFLASCHCLPWSRIRLLLGNSCWLLLSSKRSVGYNWEIPLHRREDSLSIWNFMLHSNTTMSECWQRYAPKTKCEQRAVPWHY